MQTVAADQLFRNLHTREGMTAAERAIFSSGFIAAHFREFAEQQLAQGDARGEQALRLGLAMYVLEQPKLAAEYLRQAPDSDLKHFYLGRVERTLRHFDAALEQFAAAEKAGHDPFAVAMEVCQTQREAGRSEDAEQTLIRFAASHGSLPDYLVQLGAVHESQGRIVDAIATFERALAIQPTHQAANFRLAYLLDLHGDEDRAIELYQMATQSAPMHVNALLNLAVLYEDRDDYDNAIDCLQQVLGAHPSHPRATMFLKDVEASLDMEYDEEAERNKGKREAILKTPISDFELSVRSRNCLKKLNVQTLGDLLKIGEPQLRQYKNFGETSLEEIRQMLASRGLRLGQLLEEQQMPRRPLAALRRSQVAATTGTNPNDVLLGKPVAELELSVRSRKCLQRLNVATVGELVAKSEQELLSTKNFGVTSLQEIKGRLTELGLSLRQSK